MPDNKKLGLDGRHRDINGRISQKHGNTKVETLRGIYGDGFAQDFRSDTKLSTVLDRTDSSSLSNYIKNRPTKT
jgi:hypothetical protein